MRIVGHVLMLTWCFVFLGQILLVSSCAAMTPGQAQQTKEGEFVQNLGNKAINIMVDKSLTPEQLDDKYRDMLNGAFDMQTIGEFVIGRTWLRVTPEQKQEYLKLFKELVLKTYGGRLHLYKGEDFHVIDTHPQSIKDTVVNTEITHSDGSPPTSVDWVVRHESDGKLAIIDVVVDGISQSVTRRDEFADILADNGYDFNALLNALRQKVQYDSPNN